MRAKTSSRSKYGRTDRNLKEMVWAMKALVVHALHFRLPDNFSGGMSEALRLLADYHDAHTPSQKVQVAKKFYNMSFGEANSELFDQFIEDIVNKGKRLAGILQLAEYDPHIELPPVE